MEPTQIKSCTSLLASPRRPLATVAPSWQSEDVSHQWMDESTQKPSAVFQSVAILMIIGAIRFKMTWTDETGGKIRGRKRYLKPGHVRFFFFTSTLILVALTGRLANRLHFSIAVTPEKKREKERKRQTVGRGSKSCWNVINAASLLLLYIPELETMNLRKTSHMYDFFSLLFFLSMWSGLQEFYSCMSWDCLKK